MGHRKLAVLLRMGKNRVRRVMPNYWIAVRRKRKRYVYPGKASEIAPNLVRQLEKTRAGYRVIARGKGCFSR
jgi:putative transposase